jgi:cytochrome c oxidase subunit II
MSTANTPLAYLHTAGPAADPITRLGWGLSIVSIVVVVVIAILLVVAIARRRPDVVDGEKALMPTRERDGSRWIYLGTGISVVVLFACAIWTLVTLSAIATPTGDTRLTIEVRAYQYWWRVRYLDQGGNVLLTTANEIHIPVGEPVRFRLSSGDVIHSFWVPSLGGKMDAVPGQTNVTWLQADRAGRYRGQCSEYCGAQHAHMALFVDAQVPDDFAQWLGAERTTASTEPVAPGRQLFERHCGGCHAVRGTAANGALAPDLTHLMARETIGAGALPNTREGLVQWIAHTQDVKPGNEMPVVTLSPGELDAIVDYLVTLK